MNSNKTGNPGKIIKKIIKKFLLGQLAWYEVRNLFKKMGTVTWCQVKKLKNFIGTVGMMRGKKFIIFMVQLARSQLGTVDKESENIMGYRVIVWVQQ